MIDIDPQTIALLGGGGLAAVAAVVAFFLRGSFPGATRPTHREPPKRDPATANVAEEIINERAEEDKAKVDAIVGGKDPAKRLAALTSGMYPTDDTEH